MRSRRSWIRIYGTRRLSPRPQAFDLVEDRRGDLRFRRPSDLALPVRQHDRDLVLLAVEADVGAGDVVHDDRVEPLAGELRPPPLRGALAVLGCEPDHRLTGSPLGGHAGHDVLGRLELHREATALSRELAVLDLPRPEVGG